jgi:PII-like signaling protein
MKVKMLRVVIRIKKHDIVHGKPLYSALIDFLVGAGIGGATVWAGADGFGKHGRSMIHLEAFKIDYPLMVEIAEERSKLEHLLPQIRRMVGDHGVVTLEEVLVF